MNANWEKIKEVFDLALEQPTASRSNFLRKMCGADKDLLNEVESLLEVYNESENLIEKNALNFKLSPNRQLKKKSIALSPFIPLSPSQLKGDLDNIILMALRKEPERRYASAEELSNDIQRYLIGMPIAAHPSSIRYRTEKFVKRNKIVVAALSLILLSLISGLAVSLWQYRISQSEAAKAEAVNVFLQKILLAGNTENISSARKGYSATVRDVLKDAVTRIDNGELAQQPEVKAEILQLIAEAFLTQGEYDSAERILRNLVVLRTNLSGEHSIQLLKTKTSLAGLLLAKANNDEAEGIFQQILPRLREEYRNGNIEVSYLTSAISDFALIRRGRGDSKEAEILFREVLEIMIASQMPDPYKYTPLALLSLTLIDQGKFDEAEVFLRQSIEILRQQSSLETTEMSSSLTALGIVMMEKGNLPQAEKNLKEAEVIYRKLVSPGSLAIYDNLRLQAQVSYLEGNYQLAETQINQVFEGYDKNSNPKYINYATALMIKGLTLNKLSKGEEAEKLLRQAVQLRMENLPAKHFMTAITKGALGEVLTANKKFDEAKPLLIESFESLKDSQGAENPRTILAKSRLEKLEELKLK